MWSPYFARILWNTYRLATRIQKVPDAYINIMYIPLLLTRRTKLRPAPRNERLTPPSGAVARIDLHIIEREVAGPHRCFGRTTPQLDSHKNFRLTHYALTILFLI